MKISEFRFDICWFRSIINMLKCSGIFPNICEYKLKNKPYREWSPLEKWTCLINDGLYPCKQSFNSSLTFEYYLADFIEKEVHTLITIKLLFPFFKKLSSLEFFKDTFPTFEIWESPTETTETTPDVIFVKYNALNGKLQNADKNYTMRHKDTDYDLNGMIIMNYNLFKIKKPFSHHYMYIHYDNNTKLWKSFETQMNGAFIDLPIKGDGSFKNSYFEIDRNLKYNINKGSRLCMYLKNPKPINKLNLETIFHGYKSGIDKIFIVSKSGHILRINNLLISSTNNLITFVQEKLNSFYIEDQDHRNILCVIKGDSFIMYFNDKSNTGLNGGRRRFFIRSHK